MVRRTRRGLRLCAVALALVLLAAACGDDDDDSTGSDDSEDVSFDPEGIVLAPSPLAQGTTSFDPIANQTGGMFTAGELVYDTLLREQPDGSLSPGLAEEVTVVDPQTIDVVLHDGITFTDGTPLDAEAVKFSVMRNRNSTNKAPFRTTINDLADITVEGDLELTMHLSRPSAGAFLPLLSEGETYVLSPTALKAGHDFTTEPIGAGPFVVESYTIGGTAQLRKNPDYFQADRIRVGGIDFILPGAQGQALANGLQAGQLDLAVVADSQAASLTAPITKESIVTGKAVHGVLICKDQPPLNDIRVRQALSLGTDRDALNQGVYNGNGEIAFDRSLPDSAFHNEDVADEYAYDPDAAKELLKDAGVTTPLRFNMVVSSTSPEAIAYFEVLQQQWSKIGVEITSVLSANVVNDFYVRKVAPLFNVNATGGGAPLDQIVRTLTPGNIGNACNYNDPEINQLVADLQSIDSTDEGNDEAVEVWQELNGKITDEVLNLYTVFSPQTFAWNDDRLGDVEVITQYYGALQPDYTHLYIKD